MRTVGPVAANCYRLAAGSRAVLVDPGDAGDALLAWLERDGLELEAVWLTHAHFDHVGGLAAVLAAHPVPVHLHRADLPLLERAAASAARWGIRVAQPPTDIVPIEDGGTLELAGHRAGCLFTPGHAPGHVAFHLPDGADLAAGLEPRGGSDGKRSGEDGGVLLSGDALFAGSVGRTDLPLADGPTLLRSIRERLLPLPDATVVLPGHGGPTTIGVEAATNPFL